MTSNEHPEKPGFRTSKVDGVTPKFELPDDALRHALDTQSAERQAKWEDAISSIPEKPSIATSALNETVNLAGSYETDDEEIAEEPDDAREEITLEEIRQRMQAERDSIYDMYHFGISDENLLTDELFDEKKYAEARGYKIVKIKRSR